MNQIENDMKKLLPLIIMLSMNTVNAMSEVTVRHSLIKCKNSGRKTHVFKMSDGEVEFTALDQVIMN